jgi:hypothetical protein
MTIAAQVRTAPASPLHTLMAPSRRRLIGALNVVEGAVALAALIASYGLAERLVAAQEAAPNLLATQTVTWVGPDFTVTLNMSLLIVGAAAAVAGSVVQQSIVFATRAGHENLERGFFWWYVLRLVWSALLGAIVVIAANAGLISVGDETTSTAGVAVLVTIGAVAGLFTDQALQKMQGILGATGPETPASAAAAGAVPEADPHPAS